MLSSIYLISIVDRSLCRRTLAFEAEHSDECGPQPPLLWHPGLGRQCTGGTKIEKLQARRCAALHVARCYKTVSEIAALVGWPECPRSSCRQGQIEDFINILTLNACKKKNVSLILCLNRFILTYEEPCIYIIIFYTQ